MTTEIDPVAFGILTNQVTTLTSEVALLRADMKSMLELANKSRGGFWVGMSIAAGCGTVLGWIVTLLTHR